MASSASDAAASGATAPAPAPAPAAGAAAEYAPRPLWEDIHIGQLEINPAGLSRLPYQRISGDNHCMFRAAASVIFRRDVTDGDVTFLRWLCVQCVDAQPLELLGFLDCGCGTVDEYGVAMLGKEWGGEPELRILATMTGVNFLVVTGTIGSSQAVTMILPRPGLLKVQVTAESPNYGRLTGVLQHHREKHYDLYRNGDTFVWEDAQLDALLCPDNPNSWLPCFREMVVDMPRQLQLRAAYLQALQQRLEMASAAAAADVDMAAPSSSAAAAAASASDSPPAAPLLPESPPPELPPVVVLMFGAEDPVSRKQLIASCKDDHPVLRTQPASASPGAIFVDWSILWSDHTLHKDVKKWILTANSASKAAIKSASSSDAPAQLSARALWALRLALGFNELASTDQDAFACMADGSLVHFLSTAAVNIDRASKPGGNMKVAAVAPPSDALWTPRSNARNNSAPFVFVLQDAKVIAIVVALLTAQRELAEQLEEEELENQPPGGADEADHGPAKNLTDLEPALPPVPVQVAAAPQVDAPPPPFFQPTQEALARRLIDAFRSKFGAAAWSGFTGVDFRIFVPAFNQLLLQTTSRVHKCGVMPAGGSDAARLYTGPGVSKKDAKLALREHSHVWSYVLKNNHVNNDKLDKLRAEAKSNPTVLYLLIADEAEWGCKPGGPNDKFVNDVELTALNNVVVLLVTATPYALITTHSRLPLDVEPFAYQMACGPQQLGITEQPLANAFQAGTILHTDEHRATLGLLAAKCLPPSIVQPLEHVIPWFSPPAVVDGELVILRSFNRLLLVSAHKRLAMESHEEAATRAVQEAVQRGEWPCDVSRDSAFDTDRFRLLVDPRTPLRWNANEQPKPIRVRLQHVLTGLFLSVGSPSQNDAHSNWAPAVRQAVLAPLLQQGAHEQWLSLQMHQRGSYFELGSQQADGRFFSLWTHTALGVQDLASQSSSVPSNSSSSLQQLGLYFVDTQLVGGAALKEVQLGRVPNDEDRRLEALAVLRRIGHDCEFFFAPVQHGYRSLDTYIASSAKDLHGARTTKLLRSDPIFHTSADHTAKMQLLEPSLANMRVAWAELQPKYKRCMAHTGDGCKFKEHRLKLGGKSFGGCFDDTQLLLADYVYWMLHFRAFATQHPDPIGLLGDLIREFEKLVVATPQAQCPLAWVQKWYADESRELLSKLDIHADAPLSQLRALEIAHKHISLSPEQLNKLQRLRSDLVKSAPDDLAAQHKLHESLGLDVRTETEMVVDLLLRPLMPLVQRGAGSASNSSAASGRPVRGKMVVIRVRSNKLGYCMHAGLRAAVKLLCAFSPYLDLAVIPDFDEFSMGDLEPRFLQRLQWGHKCSGEDGRCTCTDFTPADAGANCTCGHVHHRVSMYEDLLHLPCIVLLNEKGRMGDTFPHSFAAMDLRLRGNSRGNLRSVVQELGRMCRYVRPHFLADGRVQCRNCDAPYEKDFAYALIGFPLADTLHSVYSLGQAVNATSFAKSKDIASLNPPNKAKFPHPLLDEPYTFCAFKPKETMYDFVKNLPAHSLEPFLQQRLHHYRFLLEAECQIGKTGTYLALIFLLQQEMMERPEAMEVWLQRDQPVALNFHPRWAALAAGFVDYSEVGFGKYHLRVAKERLCTLLGWRNSADLQRCLRDWLFRSASGELAVSKAAQERFAKCAASQLNSWPSEAAAELDQRIERFYLPIINWDGRLLHRPTNGAAAVVSAAPAPASAASDSAAPAAAAAAVAAAASIPNAGNSSPVCASPEVQNLVRDLLRGAGEQTYLKNPKSLSHVPLSQMWSVVPPAASPPVRSRVVPHTVSEQAREWRTAVTNGSQRAGSQRVDLVYRPQHEDYFVADHPLLRISAPSLEEAQRYFVLGPLLVNGDVQGSLVVGAITDTKPDDLQRWIFTCTYNRSHAAMLDFSNVMRRIPVGAADDSAVPINYRRVIVVRSSTKGSSNSEYDKYVAAWGGDAVIMEMPPACVFPLDGGSVRATQSEGGIGFARLCVQLIARQWKLDAVWMLDDNVLRFYEIEVTAAASAVAASEHKLTLRPVPFGHVMCKMEQLLDANEHNNKLNDVEAGSWKKYGMVGCSRSLKRLQQWPEKLLQQPHSHSRCYSALLISIRGCFEDEHGARRQSALLFPPRPVWEDIEFQHVMEEGGLRVVRYDRVVHIKRNLTLCDRKPYEVPKPQPPLMVALRPTDPLDVVDSPLAVDGDEVKKWLLASHDVAVDSWLSDDIRQWARLTLKRHSAIQCDSRVVFTGLLANSFGLLDGSPEGIHLWVLVRAKHADEHVRSGAPAAATSPNRVSFQQQLLKSCNWHQQNNLQVQWWIPQGQLAERAVKAAAKGAWILLRIRRVPPVVRPMVEENVSAIAVSAPAMPATSAAESPAHGQPQLSVAQLPDQSTSPMEVATDHESDSGLGDRETLRIHKRKRENGAAASGDLSTPVKSNSGAASSSDTRPPKRSGGKASKFVAPEWDFLLEPLKDFFKKDPNSFITPWNQVTKTERSARLERAAGALGFTVSQLKQYFDEMDKLKDTDRQTLRKIFNNASNGVRAALVKLKKTGSSLNTSSSSDSSSDTGSDNDCSVISDVSDNDDYDPNDDSDNEKPTKKPRA